MSQDELAKTIRIESNHLSKLENDKYQPSIEALKKIADTLEMSTLRRFNYMFPPTVPYLLYVVFIRPWIPTQKSGNSGNARSKKGRSYWTQKRSTSGSSDYMARLYETSDDE